MSKPREQTIRFNNRFILVAIAALVVIYGTISALIQR